MVWAGQVVAELESRAQRVELELATHRAEGTVEIDVAEARLELSQSRAERVEHLFQREIATQERHQELRAERQLALLELQQAQRNHHAAQLEKQVAEEMLALRQIRSPINAVVVERLLSPGEFVHQETHVLRLAKMDPLFVEAYLPAAMLPLITSGTVASVYPQEPIGGVHLARVIVVDHVLDAASGTFGVRLELPNPGALLPAGLRCEIAFGPVSLENIPNDRVQRAGTPTPVITNPY